MWLTFTTRNLSGKDYGKSDSCSIETKCFIFNEKGVPCDSMDLTTAFGFEWKQGSLTNNLFYNSKQSLKNYADGKYTIKAYVSRSYLHGIFCDSIVELSSKTVTFYVDTKAPVQQVAQETSLNVFPNPARERISVSCETEMRRVTLFNPTGQRVRQMEPCGTEVQIPLSGLPHGLYLLRVQTASDSAVRKVVVE